MELKECAPHSKQAIITTNKNRVSQNLKKGEIGLAEQAAFELCLRGKTERLEMPFPMEVKGIGRGNSHTQSHGERKLRGICEKKNPVVRFGEH